MVFGWGKKREEKLETEMPQEKEIHLDDIPKIIEDLRQLRESQTTSEIKELRNFTAPLIEELMEIGQVLERDDLKVDDIDKHLAIIVVRGKKQVIDAIKKDVLSLPEVKNIEDASKLNLLLGQILKKIGDVLGRQTRIIHIFAKKYADQLKNNLEVMNSNHDEIQKLLKNYLNGKEASEQITKSLKEINKTKDLQQDKTVKISNIKKNIQSTNELISSLEKNIQEIKISEHYKKYLQLEKSLNDFVHEKPKIKNNIDTQFTKISRPLSRYEYGSSLDKEQKNILSQLVNYPLKVLIPKNKDSIITILENVRKGIVSGSISVKDKDKSMLHITEVEESLDGIISQVLEYTKKYQSLQNELESYDLKELNSFILDFGKNKDLMKELELKLEMFQGEVDEYSVKIPKIISDTQIKVRNYTNTKYIILD